MYWSSEAFGGEGAAPVVAILAASSYMASSRRDTVGGSMENTLPL